MAHVTVFVMWPGRGTKTVHFRRPAAKLRYLNHSSTNWLVVWNVAFHTQYLGAGSVSWPNLSSKKNQIFSPTLHCMMVQLAPRQLPAMFKWDVNNIHNVFVMLNMFGTFLSYFPSPTGAWHCVLHHTTLLQSYHPHYLCVAKGHVMNDVESKWTRCVNLQKVLGSIAECRGQ
jgi:hypothetical protein